MDARSRNDPAPPPDAAAASALETLGQLAGQFAHDINNLLASVMAGVELAARIEGDPRARALLANAIEAIRRQSGFTAAMTQAALRCERAVVLDAHAWIEACSDDLRAALGASELELRLDAADPFIRCDRGFLRTALMHLAANANAAMPDGGRLLLATRNRGIEPGERDFLRLVAVDSGRGMTQDVRRRAFDSFFTTLERADGLGLVQVRDTVRRAGGSAVLETVPGQGTSVILTFPLADREDWHET
jgi:signal transduction histidine kinase